MKVQKRAGGGYDVIGLPINNFDWHFNRWNGTAYAVYASSTSEDDETFVWEPSDKEHQDLVNKMNLFQLASWLHREISGANDIKTAAATLGRKGGKSTSLAKVQAVRENGRKGGRPKATVRCGVEYSTGTKAPPWARWALWYHGFVRYFMQESAAEKAMINLPWSDREAASIGEVN